MSQLQQADIGDAPDHPVLSEPWTYFVTGVHVDFATDSQLANSLVLVLLRDSKQIQLQFDGVQELEIDAGFPYFCMGLKILDVAHLQWDSIKIRVTGFEPAPGIRFWARSVICISA